ncbi:hypothetical protein LTR53_017654, partial [Teratosphaeriaceae sp. CCFEE 6253]
KILIAPRIPPVSSIVDRGPQIAEPCPDAAVNVQAQPFCPHDPHPHPEDGRPRPVPLELTYGPGVCGSTACRWHLGLLAPGDFGPERARKRGQPSSNPNADLSADADAGAPFDMSDATRREREARWFRLLSTDQQLEALSSSNPTPSPIPAQDLSDYARAFLNPHSAHDVHALSFMESADPSQVTWAELNPRFLGPAELQHATGRFLPASVTAPGQERGSTPCRPVVGPFAVRAHACGLRGGRCRLCGRVRGRKGVEAREEPQGRACRNLGMAIGVMDREHERVREEWEEVLRDETAGDKRVVCGGGGGGGEGGGRCDSVGIVDGAAGDVVMADGAGGGDAEWMRDFVVHYDV